MVAFSKDINVRVKPLAGLSDFGISRDQSRAWHLSSGIHSKTEDQDDPEGRCGCYKAMLRDKIAHRSSLTASFFTGYKGSTHSVTT